MKKLIAFAAAVAAGVGFTVLAWNDNSAQDAADYAATHPVVTNCKAAR
jgi:hypothetical protein